MHAYTTKIHIQLTQHSKATPLTLMLTKIPINILVLIHDLLLISVPLLEITQVLQSKGCSPIEHIIFKQDIQSQKPIIFRFNGIYPQALKFYPKLKNLSSIPYFFENLSLSLMLVKNNLSPIL